MKTHEAGKRYRAAYEELRTVWKKYYGCDRHLEDERWADLEEAHEKLEKWRKIFGEARKKTPLYDPTIPTYYIKE